LSVEFCLPISVPAPQRPSATPPPRRRAANLEAVRLHAPLAAGRWPLAQKFRRPHKGTRRRRHTAVRPSPAPAPTAARQCVPRSRVLPSRGPEPQLPGVCERHHRYVSDVSTQRNLPPFPGIHCSTRMPRAMSTGLVHASPQACSCLASAGSCVSVSGTCRLLRAAHRTIACDVQSVSLTHLLVICSWIYYRTTCTPSGMASAGDQRDRAAPAARHHSRCDARRWCG
jgi:hypothetical protein